MTTCHLWSVADVAGRLNVSKDSVYRMAGRAIPCYRTGGAVRFRPDEVEEYIESRRVLHAPAKPVTTAKLEHLQ